MTASERRSSSFWKGIDKEVSNPEEVLKTRILELYGSGPRSGGKCRSDVAHLLGIDFHVVDRVIKQSKRR